MPSIYKRGKYWWAWGYDAAGKRWLQSTKQESKNAALIVARRFEQDNSGARNRPRTTLQTALEKVIEVTQRNERSMSTLKYRAQKIAPLVRIFGANTDIHALKLVHTERYIDQRRAEGVRNNTIKKELGTLLYALNLCSEREYYVGDPHRVVPRQILRGAYVPKDRWLTGEEYRALLNTLPLDKQDYVIMWCHTGMRYSELFRVRPMDVDLNNQYLRIRGTKTKKSNRRIPLTSEALTVVYSRIGLDPLFQPWECKDLHRTVRTACAKAGIEPVTPNDFRRTFASWLANAGVDRGTIADLLGHASMAMVNRVYAQLADSTKEEAMKKLRPTLRVIDGGKSATLLLQPENKNA